MESNMSVSINRSVPIHWLFTIVGTVIGMAVMLSYDVRDLKKASEQLVLAQGKTADRVELVYTQLNSASLELARQKVRLDEHDKQLEQHGVQINLLRARK